MARYRVSGPEEFQVIAEAAGTLWERPIIDGILRNRLPDHTQDHLPLSECCIGTIEWTVSDVDMDVIRRAGGFREYANNVIGGPIL